MRELRNCNEIVKMDSRTVEGYALVFGKQSRDLGGFTEVIEPTALEGILEKSDILCLLNHNEDRGILARWKSHSTLTLLAKQNLPTLAII